MTDQFLGQHLSGPYEYGARLGDASSRYYIRLSGKAGAGHLLMVSPNAAEKLPIFIRLANLLRAHGLGAPTIYAADEKAGLALIEDFGPHSFTACLQQIDPHDETALAVEELRLYQLALAGLITLQADKGIITALGDWPFYDEAEFMREAGLFREWFVPHFGGGKTPSEQSWGEYESLLKAAYHKYAHHDQMPRTLVLRDYHVDNLIERRKTGQPINEQPIKGQATNPLGILDFQDALIGSPAYDLASLCEDARRDVSPATRLAIIKDYLAAFPDMDKSSFWEEYHIWALQRHIKVAGIFARLAVRDNKPHYLAHIPRVLDLIYAHLSFAEFTDLARWFQDNFTSLTDKALREDLHKRAAG